MIDTDRDRLEALFASLEDPTPDEAFVRAVSARASLEQRARTFAGIAAGGLVATSALAGLILLGPSLLAAIDRTLGASEPYLAASLIVAGLSLAIPRLLRLFRS